MCSRCRHFTTDPADPKIPNGFGRCAYLPDWQYRSQRAGGCHFVPSKFLDSGVRRNGGE